MIRKICIISMGCESLSVRGINNFESYLKKYDFNCDVSYFTWASSKESVYDKTYSVPYNKKIPKSINYFIYFINLIRYFILKPIDLYIVDDVSLLGCISSFFGKLLGVKTMVTIHGFYEEEWERNRLKYKKIKNLFSKSLANFTIKNADLIVINDDRMKDMFIRKGASENKIWKRYVFVDTHFFDKNNISENMLNHFIQSYQLPSSYVLFVGYLEKSEGLLDFLEVSKKVNSILPNTNYVILGHGSLENRVIEFIKDNPSISITFIKKVTFLEMPLIYYNSSVVLIPVYPPQGGIGRIKLEAFSMKKPVIATNVGIFNKAVINNFTGFLTEIGDTDLMVKYLVELLNNKGLRDKMGQNGRELVTEMYSIDTYILNWVDSLKYIFYGYTPDCHSQ